MLCFLNTLVWYLEALLHWLSKARLSLSGLELRIRFTAQCKKRRHRPVTLVPAGPGAHQRHASGKLQSRLRLLHLHLRAPQQAAGGGQLWSRRRRPVRHHRNPRSLRHSGRPQEARFYHGDLHHLQSLHQGLLSFKFKAFSGTCSWFVLLWFPLFKVKSPLKR